MMCIGIHHHLGEYHFCEYRAVLQDKGIHKQGNLHSLNSVTIAYARSIHHISLCPIVFDTLGPLYRVRPPGLGTELAPPEPG